VIVAVGHVYAQIPRRDEVQGLMLEMQAEAREQPGCLSFVFAEVLADAGHFLVVQTWLDQAALEQHYRSAAFADYQAAIELQLVRDSVLDVYTAEDAFRPVDPRELDLRQDD